MISLVFSDKHLTCAQWTRFGKTNLVTDLCSFPLLYNLSEVFDNRSDLNSLLNAAAGQVADTISFEGQEVIVVAPRSLVFHDIITMDDELTDSDASEYITWLTESRFGNESSKWETIHNRHPWNRDNLLIQWIPTWFLSLVKLTIEEKGGRPIWFGSDFMTLLPLEPRSKTGLVVSSGAGYMVTLIDDLTFRIGELFYSTKESALIPRAVEGGNLAEMAQKNSGADTDIEFLCTSVLNKSRMKHWEGYRLTHLDLFTDLSLEGSDIDIHEFPPEDLQVLAGTIMYDHYRDYDNFLKSQNDSLPERHQDHVKETVDQPQVEIGEILKPGIKRKKRIAPGLFIGALLVLVLTYFFTPVNSFFKVTDRTTVEKKVDSWWPYINHSRSIMRTAEVFFGAINPDSLYMLAMDHKSGRISWTGKQDLRKLCEQTTGQWIIGSAPEATEALPVRHGSFEIIHSENYEPDLNTVEPRKFLEILSESVTNIDIIEKNFVGINDIQYLPVIVNTRSEADLLQVFDVINVSADNVALRKLELLAGDSEGDTRRFRAYFSIFF